MAVLSCVGIGETPVPQLLPPAFAPSRRWHRVARHARRDSNSSYKLRGLRTRTSRVRTSLRVVGRCAEMKNSASRSAKSRFAKVRRTFAVDLSSARKWNLPAIWLRVAPWKVASVRFVQRALSPPHRRKMPFRPTGEFTSGRSEPAFLASGLYPAALWRIAVSAVGRAPRR